MLLSMKSESHISRHQLNIRFVLANDEEAWFRCDLVTVEQVVGGPELVEVSVAGVEPVDGDSHVLDDEGDGGGGDEDPGWAGGGEGGEERPDDPGLDKVEREDEYVRPDHLVERHKVVSTSEEFKKKCFVYRVKYVTQVVSMFEF